MKVRKTNKLKIYIILTVMVGFTLVNIIKNNDALGYIFSLLVLPLITWGMIGLKIK